MTVSAILDARTEKQGHIKIRRLCSWLGLLIITVSLSYQSAKHVLLKAKQIITQELELFYDAKQIF